MFLEQFKFYFKIFLFFLFVDYFTEANVVVGVMEAWPL